MIANGRPRAALMRTGLQVGPFKALEATSSAINGSLKSSEAAGGLYQDGQSGMNSYSCHYKDGKAILRMDGGFLVPTMPWPLLQSVFGVHGLAVADIKITQTCPDAKKHGGS